MSKRIGILGSPTDVHVQAVAGHLRTRAEVVLIDPLRLDGGGACAFLDGQLYDGDQDLTTLDAVWLRSLPNALPRPDVADLDQIVEARERAQLTLAWLMGLEDRGVPVVNSPHSSSLIISKPRQLALMRAAGVDVPRTIYTSSPDAARAFRRAVGPCIIKPVAGGAHTVDFDDPDTQARLAQITRSPVTVQEKITGDQIRVTIVGGEIISEICIATAALDYRTDPAYHAGKLYRPSNLSEPARQMALTAARAAGLTFTGLDLIRMGDRHVVLECNTSPMYLDIERKTGAPISKALADYLFACSVRAVRPQQTPSVTLG